MRLLSHRQPIEVSNIQVKVPVKANKIHVSQITYSGDELGIQVKGVVGPGNAVKVVSHIESTLKLFEAIESGVMNIIHEYSKEFFNGKTFTREKITNSMESSCQVNEDGALVIQCQESDYIYFDFLGGEIPVESLRQDDVVSVVITLDSIVYTKNLFKLQYKIYCIRQTRPRAQLEGFLETTIPKPEPAVESKTVAEPVAEPEPTAEPEPAKPANSDHLDFFE